ncbi:MAG: DUF4976 domain-containing protein, partial [Verrucomicrobia bacterium]|nr:DUF4976 domain-containing protein [Verrucomicrobiota bacterium]
AKHSAIRTESLKLLHFDSPRTPIEMENRWELFDLSKDPQEMKNLAKEDSYASELEMMKARFIKTKEFYGDTDESIWNAPVRKQYPSDVLIRSLRRPRR